MIPRLTSPMSSTRPLFGMYPSEERIAEVASQGSAVLTLEIPKGSGQQYRVFPIFLHPVIERDLVQQYQTQGFTFNDKYLYVGLPVTSNGEYDQRSSNRPPIILGSETTIADLKPLNAYNQPHIVYQLANSFLGSAMSMERCGQEPMTREDKRLQMQFLVYLMRNGLLAKAE